MTQTQSNEWLPT